MPATPPSLPTPPEKDAESLPWVNQPEFVFTDGQTIGLVHLSALVRWLMKSKNRHFLPAVRALHEALAGREDVVLYLASKAGQAIAVGPSDTFGIDAQQQQVGRLRGDLINGVYRAAPQRRPMPDGVEPGLSAALYLIRHGWGSGKHDESILEREDAYGPCLAMLCSQAAEIWGAEDVAKLHAVPEANAEPTNWPQLIKFRKTCPGTEWTVKQKNIVANEAETRMAVPGSTGVKESMAGELGMSVTHINKLIRDKDVAGKKAKTHTTAATSFPRSVSASSAKS